MAGFCVAAERSFMKESVYKSYDELPLMLGHFSAGFTLDT